MTRRTRGGNHTQPRERTTRNCKTKKIIRAAPRETHNDNHANRGEAGNTYPHPPACIGSERYAAARKRLVGKEGATHRHQERKYVTCNARR